MADTPVFVPPTGVIGRVNTGGGGGFAKVTTGCTSSRQGSNILVATVDFTPLVILTTTNFMFSEEGTIYTCNATHLSYRKSASENWLSFLVTGSRYLQHTYNEATGEIRANPSNTSLQSINIEYVILGV